MFSPILPLIEGELLNCQKVIWFSKRERILLHFDTTSFSLLLEKEKSKYCEQYLRQGIFENICVTEYLRHRMFEKICVREYLSPSNDLSDVYILLQIHLEKIKQKIQNLVVKYVPLELRKSSFKFKL